MFCLVFRAAKIWLSIPTWSDTCTSWPFLRFLMCKLDVWSKILPLTLACIFILKAISCWKVPVPAIYIGIGTPGRCNALWKSSVNVQFVISTFRIYYFLVGLFSRLVKVFAKEWTILMVESTFGRLKSAVPLHKTVRCILKWIRQLNS